MIANETIQSGRIGRRSLMAMAILGTAAPLFARAAFAEPARTDAVATVQQFNGALLAAMKAGKAAGFQGRYAILAPAVEQAFDLQTVLAQSVGPRWASLPPDQQSRLLDAFRQYTVANYVANFDNYSGQTFSVSPDARSVAPGEAVVQSRISSTSGSPTNLGYVMRETPAGWKIVDVLADGSISRVAVQRSDFRSLLEHGGGDALVASLQHKVSTLSGGALA